jgi:hypothetical protein
LTCWSGKIVLIRGERSGGAIERNCWDTCVAVGGLYGRAALFGLEGLRRRVLVETGAVNLLIHDNRVRKFPSESDYYLLSFKGTSG